MKKPWKVVTYYNNKKKAERTGENLIEALISTEEFLQKFRETLSEKTKKDKEEEERIKNEKPFFT